MTLQKKGKNIGRFITVVRREKDNNAAAFNAKIVLSWCNFCFYNMQLQ